MDVDQADFVETRGRAVAIEAFRLAADHVVALTAAVPADRWDAPALGSWTVRSLVGHTGRALSTVVEYLARPAVEHTVLSTADYYTRAAERVDAESIRLRGEQAGADLGERPAEAIRELRDQAVRALAEAGDRIVPTAVGGILLSDYVPTRTFELAVHGLDIARAIGLPAVLPAEVLRAVLPVATELAVRRGHGEAVLLALTGRDGLPAGFGVL